MIQKFQADHAAQVSLSVQQVHVQRTSTAHWSSLPVKLVLLNHEILKHHFC